MASRSPPGCAPSRNSRSAAHARTDNPHNVAILFFDAAIRMMSPSIKPPSTFLRADSCGYTRAWLRNDDGYRKEEGITSLNLSTALSNILETKSEDVAVQLVEAGLAIAGETGDKELDECNAMAKIASTRSRCFEQKRTACRRCLEIAQELGGRHIQARAHIDIGSLLKDHLGAVCRRESRDPRVERGSDHCRRHQSSGSAGSSVDSNSGESPASVSSMCHVRRQRGCGGGGC